MMVRKIAALCAWVGIVLPIHVFALGLGDVDLKSHLNEPLVAEIPLLTIDDAEINDLKVNLAPADEFRKAGIDYHVNLKDIKFEVIKRPNGKHFIRVKSTTSFREPYLNVLIEVSWGRGKILREYALLIDPPVVIPNRGTTIAEKREEKPEVVTSAKEDKPGADKDGLEEPYIADKDDKHVATVKGDTKAKDTAKADVEEEDESDTAETDTKKQETKVAAVKKAPEEDSASEEESEETETKTAGVQKTPEDEFAREEDRYPRISLSLDDSKGANVDLSDVGVKDNKYKIKKGDTMMDIAKRVRKGKASLHQTMMAIKKANPNAFINDNVHKVKANLTLVIPDQSAMVAIAHSEAIQQYTTQTETWRQGSQAPVTIAKKPEVTTGKKFGYTEVRAPRDEANTGKTPATGTDEKSKTEGNSTGKTADEDIKLAKNAEESEDWRANADKTRIELMNKIKEKENVKLVDVTSDLGASLQARALEQDFCKKNPSDATCVQKYCKDNQLDKNCFKAEGFEKVDPSTLKDRDKQVAQAFNETKETGSAGFVADAKHQLNKWIAYFKDNPFMTAILGGGILFFFILLLLIIRQHRRARVHFEESILEIEANSQMRSQKPGSKVVDAQKPASKIARSTSAQQPSNVQNGQSSYLSDFGVSAVDNNQQGLGESDPITEADVFYAYGKYEAAEMLIKEAIQSAPSRLDLRYKLLDIYHGAKNKEMFEREAATLAGMVGNKQDPQWLKVLELGRELAPELASSSAVTSRVAPVSGGRDAQTQVTPASSAEDFDLDFDFDITETSNAKKPALEVGSKAKNVVSFSQASNSAVPDFDDDSDNYTHSAGGGDLDEVGTKLDLAKAYMDMGDPEGAKSILNEVLEEGTDKQRVEAKELMQQMKLAG